MDQGALGASVEEEGLHGPIRVEEVASRYLEEPRDLGAWVAEEDILKKISI